MIMLKLKLIAVYAPLKGTYSMLYIMYKYSKTGVSTVQTNKFTHFGELLYSSVSLKYMYNQGIL